MPPTDFIKGPFFCSQHHLYTFVKVLDSLHCNNVLTDWTPFLPPPHGGNSLKAECGCSDFVKLISVKWGTVQNSEPYLNSWPQICWNREVYYSQVLRKHPAGLKGPHGKVIGREQTERRAIMSACGGLLWIPRQSVKLTDQFRTRVGFWSATGNLI